MEYEVFLPHSAEIVRSALAEPTRLIGCLPGFQPGTEPGAAADPAAPAGRLRVRIGSSTITYRGALALVPGDGGLTVEGRGTEARGDGSAALRLTVTPRPAGDGAGTTLVFRGSVEGEGRLREFGAAQREAAARRLLDRFAESLSALLSESPPASSSGTLPESPSESPSGTQPASPAESPAEELSRPVEPTSAAGGIGEPEDNERVIPGIPAAHEPEPEPGVFPRPGAPEDEDLLFAGEEDDPLVAAEEDEALAGPEPEADFARRTMIGRSAEEVDHAPPRGRYAPEPAPGAGPGASATLRWAAPAAAVALAAAVLVTRALRRRR